MNKPVNCAWVIDDDPLHVLVLNRLLTTHQAVKNTKFFSGAKSAVEALNANKSNVAELPDLIFLDLVMVRGDGWEFIEQYRKMKNKLPRLAKIVVISSCNEESAKRLRENPEVFEFLSKPVNKEHFEKVIDSIIALQSSR